MVDVVIVNWNAGDMLATCVTAVLNSAHAQNLLANVIIVDNGSVDSSLANVETIKDARIQIIKNKANMGFGAACNQGCRLGSSELILFLNPDVVVEPNVLSSSVDILRSNKQDSIAVLGIKLYDNYGSITRTCCRKPSILNMCAYAIGLGRVVRNTAAAYVMSEWDHVESRIVHHVIGAYYMIRREVFEAIGGFDERFFLYLEDLDLSTRVADAGWRCLYIGELTARHEGGGTSKGILGRRLFFSVRSRFQYAHKHFGLLGGAAVFATSVMCEIPLRISTLLARGDFAGVRFTFEGYVLLLKWIVGVGKRDIK